MNDFDPTHDKLPDQPVTIGGDKSAAVWNGASSEEHAQEVAFKEQYHEQWMLAEAESRSLRSERAALAHVIEQAPYDSMCDWLEDLRCDCWKSTAPAVSLALHDAEVKAQALDEAADELDAHWVDEVSIQKVRARAAAIREEAGS